MRDENEDEEDFIENPIADKIGTISYIIFTFSILSILLSFISLVISDFNLLIFCIFIGSAIGLFLGSVLLRGLSEIIQLLEDIKNK